MDPLQYILSSLFYNDQKSPYKKLSTKGISLKRLFTPLKIGFGMREHYLVPSNGKFVLRPITVRTKYCNYVPSVGVIFS